MQSSRTNKINPWTACFQSRKTEAAYQGFVFKRNLRANFWGATLGLILFISYIFSDFIDSARPTETATIRLVAFVLCVIILASFTHKEFAKRNDFATLAIFLIMSTSMDAIIWLQRGAEHTYYIGLIQGSILFGILLRLKFVSMLIGFSLALAGFIFATFSNDAFATAMLQLVNVGGVAAVCLLGVYLLNRYQRADFLKTQLIEEQNEQLQGLLEAAQQDNERKIAALNLLVHYIKTPLHQITGFSDILVNSIGGTQGGEPVENAKYIKNATVNLTKSVNGLLNYHRLDEVESRNAPEPVAASTIVEDFTELLHGDIEYSKGDIDKGSINADPEILRAAVNGLTDHYSEECNGTTRIVISASNVDGAMALTIRDDASILSAAQYEDLVQPLTQIKTYLGHSGGEMAMALRTVARAVEIAGGDMVHSALADGNRYVLKFPAADVQAAAA